MLEAVRSRARPYFEGAPPAHDWHHVTRVATLAETLVDRHPDPADERVVQAAVWLHDVGRAREDRGLIDDHAEWGAREAETILEDLGASAETVDRVTHCVRSHRYSNDVVPETVEARLVCDADNLDALGAVGLARVFAHGGTVDSPIHDETVGSGSDPAAGESQYAHVHEKILDIPEQMYTDVGRELADARGQFVREFVAQFDAETEGKA